MNKLNGTFNTSTLLKVFPRSTRMGDDDDSLEDLLSTLGRMSSPGGFGIEPDL